MALPESWVQRNLCRPAEQPPQLPYRLLQGMFFDGASRQPILGSHGNSARRGQRCAQRTFFRSEAEACRSLRRNPPCSTAGLIRDSSESAQTLPLAEQTHPKGLAESGSVSRSLICLVSEMAPLQI